jgi:hypothetical protein
MERDIAATARAGLPFPSARQLLLTRPADAFAPTARGRTFRSTVAAPLPGGVIVEHPVLVKLGRVEAEGDGVGLSVAWTADGHERLVPSFVGRLVLGPAGPGSTELTLAGAYTVPLGPVGRFGDTVVGRRIARASVEQVLDRLVRTLEAVHRDRFGPDAMTPTPPNVDLREHGPHGDPTVPSEHFIG